MNAKLCLHCGSTSIAIGYPGVQGCLLTAACRDSGSRGNTAELPRGMIPCFRRRIRRP